MSYISQKNQIFVILDQLLTMYLFKNRTWCGVIINERKQELFGIIKSLNPFDSKLWEDVFI